MYPYFAMDNQQVCPTTWSGFDIIWSKTYKLCQTLIFKVYIILVYKKFSQISSNQIVFWPGTKRYLRSGFNPIWPIEYFFRSPDLILIANDILFSNWWSPFWGLWMDAISLKFLWRVSCLKMDFHKKWNLQFPLYLYVYMNIWHFQLFFFRIRPLFPCIYLKYLYLCTHFWIISIQNFPFIEKMCALKKAKSLYLLYVVVI